MSRQLACLDVGSGPAPVSYAVADFYASITQYATDHSIERMAIKQPQLSLVELDDGMRRFFHHLSEQAGRPNGPFGVLTNNFEGFDPKKMRKAEARATQSYWDSDENTIADFPCHSGPSGWLNDLHRYQLVMFSNFLTDPQMPERFVAEIRAVFREQRPGGIVVVMGAIGGDYDLIYSQVDALAGESRHHRLLQIPPVFDDRFRRPFFGRLKRIGNEMWSHLVSTSNEADFEKKRQYPPIWDPEKPITKLRSFTMRVYKR